MPKLPKVPRESQLLSRSVIGTPEEAKESASHDAFQQALALLRHGKLHEAREMLERVVAGSTAHVDALHLLGVIAYQLGQHSRAVELIDQAIALKKDSAEAHSNRGVALHALNRLDEAIASYERAIALNPNFAEACFNQGNALNDLKRFGDALISYDRAIALKPDHAKAHNNRGNALKDLNRPDEALRSYDRAIALKPDYAVAYYNRGNALRNLKRVDEALADYERAIALNPDFAEAYNNRGLVLYERKRFEDSLASYERAISLNPCYAEAHNNRGMVLLANFGDYRAANHSHAKAVELKPNSLGMRASWLAAALPVLYNTPEEVVLTRKDYVERLQSLVSLCTQASPGILEDLAGVGDKTFFYLPYQAQNDCRLQSALGQTLCDIFGELYSSGRDDSRSLRPFPAGPNAGRIHIGIVSHYFRDHSNWKVPIRGWVEHIDRDRFHLSAYYTDSIEDVETSHASRLFNRFVQETSIDRMCRILREDRPDVLMFPGVGMDKASLHLAALRFAPVQCASWGHPVTTGMPSIDYFLSSDLMETDQADGHYSEKLIRLPNLSIHYALPDVAPVDLNRASLGLPENGALFFCPQSLQKYLPQHDDLFVNIARRVPHAKFLFLSHERSARVSEQLKARLHRAFAVADMSGDERLVFLPRLDSARFRAMSRVADVCLDTPDWSGCNSSLELLAGGLPVVTLPGEFMRGRHTYAILKMMGMEELIADSPQAYVELAVKLAQDCAWQKAIRERILQCYPRVCGDLAPVRALEAFFVEALASAGIRREPLPDPVGDVLEEDGSQ